MPAIKPYADRPARLTGQLLTDLLFLGWVVAWLLVGHVVHDQTMELAGPGQQTVDSATGLAGGLNDAGESLQGLPVVGDGAAVPFTDASSAAQQLADAGRAEIRAVERLAFWLGISIAGIPILVVGSRYLPGRLRAMREAGAGQRFLDGPADLDLFALRAMTHQPMHVLARVSDDPVGALRRDDREVIARLADLELREHGLRTPAPAGRAH
jgi:hypothetical protein